MNKEIVQKILAEYGIPIRRTELLSDRDEQVFHVVGHESLNFLLRLQESSKRSDQAVETQLAWMSSMRANVAIRIPQPVPLPSGDLYGIIDAPDSGGPMRYRLFEWVEGERKTADEWVERENLFTIGQSVAQLHQHSHHYGLSAESDVRTLSSSEFLGENAAVRTRSIEPFLGKVGLETFFRYAEQVQSALEDCIEIESERGLIHADLGPQNWIFDDGKPGLIDFDSCAIGYFMHDLLGVLWSHSHWDQNEKYVNWLFSGYESVRAVSDCVKQHAFKLQAAHCFMWIDWVLSMSDSTARNDLAPYIPEQVNLIAKLCEQNREKL